MLENWEDTQKNVKQLTSERKYAYYHPQSSDMVRFLREKLDCFLKSQHFNVSDEVLTSAIMAKNNDIAPGQNPFGVTNSKMGNVHQSHHSSSGQHQSKKRAKKEAQHFNNQN